MVGMHTARPVGIPVAAPKGKQYYRLLPMTLARFALQFHGRRAMGKQKFDFWIGCHKCPKSSLKIHDYSLLE